MKREGFILVFVDPTEMYSMTDAVICTGDSVRGLKDVVETFDKRYIVWNTTHKDVFGRQVIQGYIEDDEVDFYDSPFYDSPFYVIYQIKPPKTWRLVR